MAHKYQRYITLTEQCAVMAKLYTGIWEVPPSNLARKRGLPYDFLGTFRKIAKSDYYF
jgi:hypothetical protein